MPSHANTPRRILRAKLQDIALDQAAIDAEILAAKFNADPFAAVRTQALLNRSTDLADTATQVRAQISQLPIEPLRPEEVAAVEFLRAVGWNNSATEVESLLIDPLVAIVAVARFHLSPAHQDQYHEVLARLVAA